MKPALNAKYTAKELLDLDLPCLPNTVQNILRRAKRENWAFIYEKCQGPSRRAFLAHLLPEYVKEAILARKKADRFSLIVSNGQKKQPAATQNLTDAQKQTALARADLMRLYVAHVARAPWGKKDQAKADFLSLYSIQEWPHLHSLLGEVSLQSIERWKKIMDDTGDAFALADRRGSHKRGKRSILSEQALILERLALNPNRPKISFVVRMAQIIMEKRGIDHHSKATYRRYLEEYKAKHYDTWVFAREGEKGLNDKVAYNLKRDYSKIQVGDVVVADGHVLNFEIINPWTGKPKRMTLILFYDMKSNMPLGWEIMPTENTAAISSALRRAIIVLGKYPKCAYLDNGRAFKARFFTNAPEFDEAGLTGLYARLGIETTFAWAYHGQSKTVERFFGVLHDAEVWMPTYVGNNVYAKPPRMNRGEKLHVALWEKATQGLALTMDQAHQLIAAFFDEYANREQGPDSHLAGLKPIDVFNEGRGPGVDRDELRELMMDAVVKRIGQDGIRLFNEEYYHPALYGRRDQVKVRYDLMDRSSVLVYEDNGRFLCEAAPRPGVHPMAKLGGEEDQELLREQIELKKSLTAQTVGPARELLKNEVMPDYMRQLEGKGIVPINGGAAKQRQPKKQKELSSSEVKRIETEFQQRLRENEEMKSAEATTEEPEAYVPTVVSAAAMVWEEVECLDGSQRYERLVELSVRGTLIPKRWRAWMDYFEQTPDYTRQLDYWDEYRAKMAFCWQVERESLQGR
ncbi:MAG: Mu transposase C-terminal domain-containing protein [Thermodesulfobacteriota bacterium]